MTSRKVGETHAASEDNQPETDREARPEHQGSGRFVRAARRGPGGADAYPIQDKAHGANALARVADNGTPAEQAKVRAAVKAKYPNLPSSQGKGGSAAAAAAKPAAAKPAASTKKARPARKS